MKKRLCLLALMCLAALPARAEEVLARLSPLPLVAEDGSVTDSTAISFGARLRVLADEGRTLLVAEDTGRELRVRASDVVILPQDPAVLQADTALAAGMSGRPDMPLWDSPMRARSFLGSPGKGGAGPVLTLSSTTDLPDVRLPILSAQTVLTSIGSGATLLEVLFPMQPAALAGGAPRTDEIMLHVITDGSDYATSFALDTLDHLSRRLAAADGLPGAFLRASRHVIYDSGETRFEGEVPLSHLRAGWPAAASPEKAGGLTLALSDSIAQLADVILPGDDTGHVIMILVGPGLAEGDATLRAAHAAGSVLAQRRQTGADLRGIVLIQATPEPNPANDALLQAVSGGAPTRSLGFGEDALASVATLVAAAPPAGSEATAQCGPAAAAGLFCLAPQADGSGAAFLGVDQAASPVDWVATPLWLVADSAPFHILPAGLSVSDAGPLQDRLRACLAQGRVWASGICQAAGAGIDQDGRVADLSRQLADLAARSDGLRAALETATEDLATARDERVAIEAELNGRLEATLQERDGLAGDLAQAQGELQDLSLRLDEAADALADAEGEMVSLREALTARLEDALAERDLLAGDLEQARTDGEAVTRRLEIAISQVATLQTGADALKSDLAARAAALLEAEAVAAAAQSRIADLEATVATLTAEAAEVADARAAERLRSQEETAGLRQALAESETQAGDLAARLADAEAERAAAAAALAAEQVARQSSEQSLAEAMQRIAMLQTQPDDTSPDLAGKDAQHEALLAQIAGERTLRDAAERAAAAAVAERDALVAALDQARAAEGELAAMKAAQADLQARAEAADRAMDRVAQLEAEIALLHENGSTQMVAEAASPTASAPAPAPTPASATAKPRPRPASTAGATAPAAPAATDPPAPQGSLSILSADRKAEPSTKRRVAPAQQAPQLNGCAFQWVGKEGRLVCP